MTWPIWLFAVVMAYLWGKESSEIRRFVRRRKERARRDWLASRIADLRSERDRLKADRKEWMEAFRDVVHQRDALQRDASEHAAVVSQLLEERDEWMRQASLSELELN